MDDCCIAEGNEAIGGGGGATRDGGAALEDIGGPSDLPVGFGMYKTVICPFGIVDVVVIQSTDAKTVTVTGAAVTVPSHQGSLVAAISRFAG